MIFLWVLGSEAILPVARKLFGCDSISDLEAMSASPRETEDGQSPVDVEVCGIDRNGNLLDKNGNIIPDTDLPPVVGAVRSASQHPDDNSFPLTPSSVGTSSGVTGSRSPAEAEVVTWMPPSQPHGVLSTPPQLLLNSATHDVVWLDKLTGVIHTTCPRSMEYANENGGVCVTSSNDRYQKILYPNAEFLQRTLPR